MIEIYKFGPVPLTVAPTYQRADLEIYGINTFRPSFSGLVFLNDPAVTEKNCSEDRPNYAGRFDVFGHPTCVGDEGHCHVVERHRRFDDRPSHPLTPAFRRVVITDALRRVRAESDRLAVTIVVGCAGDSYEGKRLLEISGLQIATFS